MAPFQILTPMHFSIGSTEQKMGMSSTEQKMGMSLDDIIKHTKKASGKNRVPIKNRNNRNRKPNGPGAKAALQKSVASRSSGMRQGKFAEARARSGTASFPATQAAGKRAFAAPINTRSRQIMKNNFEAGRKNAFARKRNGQKGPNTYPAAAGNMTISVVNDASKIGVGRSGGNFRRRNAPAVRNVPAVGNRQVIAAHVPNQAHIFQAQRPKTLDSLFASIRNSTQQAAPTFNGQRGGRRRGGGVPQGGRRLLR